MAEEQARYLRARAAFAAWRAAEPIAVGDRGRSLLLDHGRRTSRVVLLLHGLTAAPRQFLAFGALLHRAGDTVVIPRLPFHGHDDRLDETLAHLRRDHLRTFADAALELAADFGERAVVLGFSVGGLLAAWLAQHRRVHRVVAVAPFLGFAGVPRPLATPGALLARRLPNVFVWWDPTRRERPAPAHGYPRYATHAVAEAYALGRDLLAAAATEAPRTRDIVVVRNASETAVRNRTMRLLAKRWNARAPGCVREHRIDGLPPSHDVIEPSRSPRLAARVYPVLFGIARA